MAPLKKDRRSGTDYSITRIDLNGRAKGHASDNPVQIPNGRLGAGRMSCVAPHERRDFSVWFDDLLTPHLQPSKPPTAVERARAKWGIGGQAVWLWDAEFGPEATAAQIHVQRWRLIAAQAFVLGGWPIHLATSSAEEIS